MKKLIVLFIFCFTSLSFSQAVWTTQRIDSSGGNILRRVKFVNSLTGFASGANKTLIKTTNGGSTWNKIQLSNLSATDDIDAMFFLNENTGWIGVPSSKLVKTTDGGNTWVYNEYSIGQIASIFFVNAQTGYMAALHRIYKSTDGGTSWNLILTAPNFNIFGGIKFLNEQTGWATAGSYFVKTTNAGANWNVLLTSGNNEDFYFINDQTGWVSTYHELRRTNNGGLNWQSYYMPLEHIFSVLFINQNIGWVAGLDGQVNGGCVWRTTNGGSNWQLQVNEPGNIFYELFFLDENKGFVSGYGSISYTNNGSLVSVENNIQTPEKYSLYQNYPNPFNPSTKINYEIKSPGFVSLKVFDLLGEEVATLVNEKQNAGSYAVDFNSTQFNLPSGIYFYTLSAGEFKETRKMVLVK